jgi:hypothetical protein
MGGYPRFAAIIFPMPEIGSSSGSIQETNDDTIWRINSEAQGSFASRLKPA